MDTFRLQDLADKAVRYAEQIGIQYCDARAEQRQQKSALIENNTVEFVRTNDDKGIGVRIAKDNVWSFCSITNPRTFGQIKDAIDDSIKSAGSGSSSIKKNKIQLCPTVSKKSKIDYPVTKKPELEELVKMGLEAGSIISETPKIIKSSVSPRYSVNSKYFVNSEGSEILQNFTDTVIDMVATARYSGITQSVNVTEGGRGGTEQLSDRNKIQQSAKNIALKASELTLAKLAKEEKATVVMNPDFVSLLTHEILGHPSEADRVLGKEMAWAGGSWWKDKLGKRIGSEDLNVFDDPTIKESLGWYQFDDEGVETRKTTLVENGILKNHMQNRETSKEFNTVPTGNMRATNYRFIPLIRMACTCIGNGDRNVNEIIKGVRHGYLVSNMKIPSIDMKRYNWSISCQYAHKIENGEVTDLLRDVIVTGTAPDFFESIDACGNDFTIRPITNCGKGDPMQSIVMGNGGPTIRGTATVRSAN